MRKIIILCFFTSSITGFTQNVRVYDNQNFWLNQTFTFCMLSKFSVHSEIQWRRADWIHHPQQFLIRLGVNRDFGNGLSASAGYCYVYTSKYGDIPVKSAFPENRGWLQLQQKISPGRIEMVERIRLEQRWVHTPVQNSPTSVWEAGPDVYSNRARILQRLNIALNKKHIENGVLYLAFYDEFFASFGKNVPSNIFDQNRAFAGVGMQLPTIGRIELGYLNQLINKGYSAYETNGSTAILNKREQNNIISLSIFTTLPCKERLKSD